MSKRITNCILVGMLMMKSITAIGQSVGIQGKVIESKTGAPLVDAFVRLRSGAVTVTDRQGEFRLPGGETDNDSISVSYLGFATITISLQSFRAEDRIFKMIERAYELPEVIITGTVAKRKAKQIEASMRVVKEKIFAGFTEVTNADYIDFLIELRRNNQQQLYEEYRPRYTQGERTLSNFFSAYHVPAKSDSAQKQDYSKYPVVNITQKAATAYCDWVTTIYNADPKRKYNTVIFRLPSLAEWRIAALGYKGFQSWELEENIVEVRIPDNDFDEVGGKKKAMISVKDNEILYPWYGSYNYRNKAQNRRNCWMGNFSVPPASASCVVDRPGGDGYEITAPVGSFFSNGMGLFDVVGNVAEMIDEPATACGGSWNHTPDQCTMQSKSKFNGRDPAVGFRVFMEIVKP